MTGWTELVAAALLGTERRQIPPEALAVLDWEVPAHQEAAAALLDLASAYSPYRKAGALPASRPEVAVAPAQELPFAPTAAQELLGQLLDARSSVAVEEWLAVCASKGLGVAPQYWPALADFSVSNRETDLSVLRQTYGVRGLAFLGLRGEWGRLLRGGDERPRLNREEVEARWEEAGAKERFDLLDSLPHELGPEDEAFLEAARTDRRASVSSKAAELLSKMPTSSYSRKLTERALACVTVERHRLRRDKLTVHPVGPSDELAADGIAAKPPTSYDGKQSTWTLHSLLAAADLGAWTRETGLSASDLLALAGETPSAETLRKGWRAATVRQRNEEWAAALVAAGEASGDVVSLVPPAVLLGIARTALRKDADNAENADNARTLMRFVRPWPSDLVEEMLARLLHGKFGRVPDSYVVEEYARAIGLPDLPLIEAALRRGADPKLQTAAAIDRQLTALHALVATRSAVHVVFNQPATTGEQP
jgi:hypothetical protein